MKKFRPLRFSWVQQWRENSDLKPSARHVLSALAAYMDHRGVAWPSLTTLARDTGLVRRSVYRSLAEAEAEGWIERERGAGPSGRGGRVTLYRAISRDMESRSRDRDDTEVGTWCPPEDSEKTQGILTPSLSVLENGPMRLELVEAIEAGATTLVETAGVHDFTMPEARWLLDGLHRAEEVILTADVDTVGLVASVLADLQRKGRPWGRQRFRAFMEAAIRIRSVKDSSDGDYDAALVSVAWSDIDEPGPSGCPLGLGEGSFEL